MNVRSLIWCIKNVCYRKRFSLARLSLLDWIIYWWVHFTSSIAQLAHIANWIEKESEGKREKERKPHYRNEPIHNGTRQSNETTLKFNNSMIAVFC